MTSSISGDDVGRGRLIVTVRGRLSRPMSSDGRKSCPSSRGRGLHKTPHPRAATGARGLSNNLDILNKSITSPDRAQQKFNQSLPSWAIAMAVESKIKL